MKNLDSEYYSTVNLGFTRQCLLLVIYFVSYENEFVLKWWIELSRRSIVNSFWWI